MKQSWVLNLLHIQCVKFSSKLTNTPLIKPIQKSIWDLIVLKTSPKLPSKRNRQNVSYIYLSNIYRVSHESRSLLRESVPYVKICRYNPKHLVQTWTVTEIMATSKSVGFWGVHVLYAVRDAIFIHCARPAKRRHNAVTLANALQHGSSDVTR